MAARKLLQPQQFKYEIHYEPSKSVMGAIEAKHPKTGTHVGHLYWDVDPESPQHHQVTMVYTRRGYTRRGIASRMWMYAQSLDPHISHSAVRTKKGEKWAKKVGGHLPEKDVVTSREIEEARRPRRRSN